MSRNRERRSHPLLNLIKSRSLGLGRLFVLSALVSVFIILLTYPGVNKQSPWAENEIITDLSLSRVANVAKKNAVSIDIL